MYISTVSNFCNIFLSLLMLLHTALRVTHTNSIVASRLVLITVLISQLWCGAGHFAYES